jgi:hypothetical protein
VSVDRSVGLPQFTVQYRVHSIVRTYSCSVVVAWLVGRSRVSQSHSQTRCEKSQRCSHSSWNFIFLSHLQQKRIHIPLLFGSKEICIQANFTVNKKQEQSIWVSQRCKNVLYCLYILIQSASCNCRIKINTHYSSRQNVSSLKLKQEFYKNLLPLPVTVLHMANNKNCTV